MENNGKSKSKKATSTLRLVQKAQLGDGRAFGDLIRRYQNRLHSFIFLRLGPRLRKKIEPDDIFQETILRAFLSLKDLEWQDKQSFFNWLGGIAEHVIKNQVRYHFQTVKRGREESIEMPIFEDRPMEVSELTDSKVPSPSKALLRKERFQRLENALRKLKQEYREVIILARIRGLPIREIAARMDRSCEAVSMLLLRALRQLKSAFGDTASFHLPPLNLELQVGGGSRCESLNEIRGTDSNSQQGKDQNPDTESNGDGDGEEASS